jgi:hypothetical protein
MITDKVHKPLLRCESCLGEVRHSHRCDVEAPVFAFRQGAKPAPERGRQSGLIAAGIVFPMPGRG